MFLRLGVYASALLFCMQAAADAAIIQRFDIDLRAVNPSNGHELSVTGSITLDPSKPVETATIATSFLFQHNDDPAFALREFPDRSSLTIDLEWNVDGSNLYINRTSTSNRGISWSTETPRGLLFFASGEFSMSHLLRFNGDDHTDFAVLKGPTGPDGPMGFLVGTNGVIVPEPSVVGTYLMMTGLAALRRKRHQTD